MSHQDPTEQAPVDTGHPLHDATDPNCQHCRLTRAQQGMHIHTSSTGAGFDPACENCRDIEAGRRNWSNMEITLQAPDQPKRPESWMVQDPYGRTDHMFERPDLAMAFAGSISRSDRPTIVTDPDGVQVLVLRVDPRVTVQAVRNLAVQPRAGRSGPPVESLPVRDFESAEFPVKVAKTLRVERYGAQPARLFIDGDPFPYATQGGYAAGPATKNSLPSVTFTLVGYNVEFVDLMGKRSDGDPTTQAVPVDVATRLVAQGRREAAEAIRQQARMFGAEDKFEGEQGTMLSFEVAAQLAEGTTGVKAGGQ